MPTAQPDTLTAVPPPERVRGTLRELYRQTRLARSLLCLSEQIHEDRPGPTVPPGGVAREAAHAAG